MVRGNGLVRLERGTLDLDGGGRLAMGGDGADEQAASGQGENPELKLSPELKL
jgi:hypothetical protein